MGWGGALEVIISAAESRFRKRMKRAENVAVVCVWGEVGWWWWGGVRMIAGGSGMKLTQLPLEGNSP